MNRMPTEHAEQVTFVSQFRAKYPGVRIFAIPNGSFRHKATAVSLKQEGVSSGVPDLYIPAWRVWVEMKRTKGGRLSAEQKDWINYLESVGDTVLVCNGWQAAMEAVEAWLK